MHHRLAAWHAEHMNFAHLLTMFEAQLEIFGAGGTPQYELMLDIAYYLSHYSDALHHPREDVAFAILKNRDARLTKKIDRLAHEHAHLKALGEQLARELEDIVNGSIAPREQLQRCARDYVGCLRAHMDVEEGEILFAAQRLLSDDDWAQVDAAVPHVDDPLLATASEERFAALRAQIARESSCG